jgi:hypothetical protein
MDRLIAARCDIDLRNKESTWPLYAAACAGHASVTALLIAARCSIDLQTNDGGTALHAATSRMKRANALGSGHEKIVEQLIEARCTLDLQTKDGATALHIAALHGMVTVAKHLIAARCDVDLRMRNGLNALQIAQNKEHNEIATLIRNKKHKRSGKVMKDTPPPASPDEIKQQQEDAERAMNELLEDEQKAAAAAAAVLQKKKLAKKAGKERRRKETDGQGGSQREEHAEEQKDMKKTEAKAESDIGAAQEFKSEDLATTIWASEALGRKPGERLMEEDDLQKEETDFCRVWRGPIELLEKVNEKRNLSAVGPRRPLPWMQDIRETTYDFSKLEEDDGEKLGERKDLLMPPMQAPKKMFNVGASDFVPSLGGFAEDGSSGIRRMEGEVDVERNMENDTAEDSLPGDMSDEQWLRTNSAENLTLWYTDQVRKWYRHAV